jgi:hypothetical protein
MYLLAHKASQRSDCEEEANDAQAKLRVIFQDADVRPYTASYIHPARSPLPLLR